MFRALPSPLGPVLSLSVTQGGRGPTYPLGLTSKHFVSAPPQVQRTDSSGGIPGFGGDRFRGMDTFLLPLNCMTWSPSCLGLRLGVGLPLS